MPAAPPEVVEVEIILTWKDRFFEIAIRVKIYVTNNVQEIANGATLGLGISASVIIFIWGASTLLSLPVSLGLLFAVRELWYRH